MPWVALRVYLRNMFTLLERGRDRSSGIVGGSVPPGSEELWNYARQHGYGTDLLRRVEFDNGKLGEQGVDEVICLKMANVVLDFPPPQVLVVATGDGRISEFGVGFISQLERALEHGWSVEIYSWKAQTSGGLRALSATYGDRAVVIDLDPFYDSLTFVKGGDYHLRTEDGSTVNVQLAGRVVNGLPDLSALPVATCE